MSRILKVFYGVDRLPYKDQERQVHYPNVGDKSFAGSSLVDTIRFYVRDIGGTLNTLWVSVVKRADGKKGYKQLTSGYDSDLGEHYVDLDLSQWYLEVVGDLTIALNGYPSGSNITISQDNGNIYVSGNPIVMATGSVKYYISYAPVMDSGYGEVPTISVAQALSDLVNKLDIDSNTYIRVVSSSDLPLSDLEDGAIVYVRDTKILYKQDNGSLVEFKNLGTTINYEPNFYIDENNQIVYYTFQEMIDKIGLGNLFITTFENLPTLAYFEELELVGDITLILSNNLGSFGCTTNDSTTTFNTMSITFVDIATIPTYTLTGSSGTLDDVGLNVIKQDNSIILHERTGGYDVLVKSRRTTDTTTQNFVGQLTQVYENNVCKFKRKTISVYRNHWVLLEESTVSYYDKTQMDIIVGRLTTEINNLKYRCSVLEEAVVGEDTLTFTALISSVIPNVSDNSYPIIASAGLDTKEIKGNSFVHTQLVQNGNFEDTSVWTVSSGSVSISNNVCSLVPTNINSFIYQTADIVANHKYLLKAEVKGVVANENIFLRLDEQRYDFVSTTSYQLCSSIITATSTANAQIRIGQYTPQGSGVDIKNAMLNDLTKDFGAGNEPTTYDQAVSMYASKGIDITQYVEYTQGTLVDSKPTKLYSRKAILANLPLKAIAKVDLGTLNYIYNSEAGHERFSASFPLAKAPSANNVKANIFCSKYIVETATNIYLHTQDKSIAISETGEIRIYDSEYTDAATLKTAMSGVYLYFELATPNAQPTQDIITDLVINEYTPTSTLYRSAGNAHDTDKKVNVGSADLGTLGFVNTDTPHVFRSSVISDIKPQTNNLLCSLYECSNVYPDWATVDKTLRNYDNSGIIRIKDTSINDASQITGIFNYELATPIDRPTITLPDDIEIEKGGSLEVVYDDGYGTPSDFEFATAVYKPLQ